MTFSKTLLELLNETVPYTLHSKILPTQLTAGELTIMLTHLEECCNAMQHDEDSPEEEILLTVISETVCQIDTYTFEKLAQNAKVITIDCTNTDLEVLTSIHVGETIQTEIKKALRNHSTSAFIITSPLELVMIQTLPTATFRCLDGQELPTYYPGMKLVGTFDDVPVYCNIYGGDDAGTIVANDYGMLKENQNLYHFKFQNMSFI